MTETERIRLKGDAPVMFLAKAREHLEAGRVSSKMWGLQLEHVKQWQEQILIALAYVAEAKAAAQKIRQELEENV